MPKLAKERLNEIWRSGFCRETVRFAATTTDDTSGSRARLEFLQKHVYAGDKSRQVCMDCAYANRLKMLEAVVARRLGPEAERRFLQGGDISTHKDFAQAFAETLEKAISIGGVDEKMMEWMNNRAKRSNTGWEEEPS